MKNLIRQYTWQGQDAIMVSALKSIISQKLKNALRDEQY